MQLLLHLNAVHGGVIDKAVQRFSVEDMAES